MKTVQLAFRLTNLYIETMLGNFIYASRYFWLVLTMYLSTLSLCQDILVNNICLLMTPAMLYNLELGLLEHEQPLPRLFQTHILYMIPYSIFSLK